MATISTPIRSPQALKKVVAFIDRNFRPWCALTKQDRRWDPQDVAVWPSRWLDDADHRSLRLGFLEAAESQERAYQQAVIKWVALRFGRLKAFDHLEFPFRRCFPFPSRGHVPYLVEATDDELTETPLLIKHLWTSDYLLADAVLPERLHTYLVDARGFSTEVNSDYSFRQTAEAELDRLSARLEASGVG